MHNAKHNPIECNEPIYTKKYLFTIFITKYTNEKDREETESPYKVENFIREILCYINSDAFTHGHLNETCKKIFLFMIIKTQRPNKFLRTNFNTIS